MDEALVSARARRSLLTGLAAASATRRASPPTAPRLTYRTPSAAILRSHLYSLPAKRDPRLAKWTSATWMLSEPRAAGSIPDLRDPGPRLFPRWSGIRLLSGAEQVVRGPCCL